MPCRISRAVAGRRFPSDESLAPALTDAAREEDNVHALVYIGAYIPDHSATSNSQDLWIKPVASPSLMRLAISFVGHGSDRPLTSRLHRWPASLG
jgi:hypothetical protein